MTRRRRQRASVSVEVQTDGRDTLFGTLLAPAGEGRPNSIADVAGLLNDERSFLPFTLLGQERLRTQKTYLNKSQVVSIRLITETGEERVRAGEGQQRCHIFLATGECVSGILPVALLAPGRRLHDVVGHGDPFVTILSDHGPILINRTKVVQVV